MLCEHEKTRGGEGWLIWMWGAPPLLTHRLHVPSNVTYKIQGLKIKLLKILKWQRENVKDPALVSTGALLNVEP